MVWAHRYREGEGLEVHIQLNFFTFLRRCAIVYAERKRRGNVEMVIKYLDVIKSSYKWELQAKER